MEAGPIFSRHWIPYLFFRTDREHPSIAEVVPSAELGDFRSSPIISKLYGHVGCPDHPEVTTQPEPCYICSQRRKNIMQGHEKLVISLYGELNEHIVNGLPMKHELIALGHLWKRISSVHNNIRIIYWQGITRFLVLVNTLWSNICNLGLLHWHGLTWI